MNESDKILVISPACEGWPEWPLGMAYVLACLEDNNIEFDFIDMATAPRSAIMTALKSGRHYAIATGGMLSFFDFFKDLVAICRKTIPGVPVILGGHIVKDGSDELLFENIGVDFAVLGEAELTLPMLLNGLRAGRADFANEPGIVCRDGQGSVARTPPKRLNLSKRNILPAWHNFDCQFYIDNSQFSFLGKRLRYIPVMSGRGCIGKCGFCSPSTGGFIKRPVKHVIDEIRHLIASYDFDHICFLNEMFYPTTRLIQEFCEAYMRLERRKKWFVQLRVDIDMDEDTLRMMKEAGCVAVSAGIESGSNDVLRAMNKRTTTDQIRGLNRLCGAVGMPFSGTFILGYESETEEDIKRTIDLLIEEDISSGEALLFIYPGTAIYETARRQGRVESEEKQIHAISGDLFRPNAPKEFCNLTAMTTDRFFKVATREIRRYYTHLITKCTPENLRLDISRSPRWTKILMRGNCSTCGAEVEHSHNAYGGGYIGSLGPGVDRQIICPGCFRPIVFNPFAASNARHMADHLEHLRRALGPGRRVVLYGVTPNLTFLLRSDLFGLDYESVAGIHSPAPFPHDSYLNYSMLDEDELCETKADCVLCTDDSVPPSAIEQLYITRGRLSPPVFHLVSDRFREELWCKRCLTYRVNSLVKRVSGKGLRELIASLRPGA